jgi:hypothetical protein
MSSQSYLLSIAGMAAGFAGFAGLVSAFRRGGEEWTSTELWRLRLIVRFCFSAVFLAVVPIPLFALINDQRATVRIASLLIAVVIAFDSMTLLPYAIRTWPGDRRVFLPAAIDGAFGLLQLVNALFGSLGIYELGLIQLLARPADIFLRVLASFAEHRSSLAGDSTVR